MNREQITAELRLFKSFTITDEMLQGCNIREITSCNKGLIYTRTITDDIREIAEDMYGLKPEQWNATFHKSFQTILDKPIEVLIEQQLLHYFTTYGLESIDMYNNDLVYIPHEQLDIPELTENLELQVIRDIDENQLSEKLMTLLTSGVALSHQTIIDIMSLSDYIDKTKFDSIKNREIKIALYEKYNITPRGNMDFLRYVIYKLTGQTLYIQNRELISAIRQSDKSIAFTYFKNYVSNDSGYKRLAEIFLRNKNIFLAFKTKNAEKLYEQNLNTIINKISKLSGKYHKPLKVNILDKLTSLTTMKAITECEDELLQELDKVTIYREIRILNGLKYRYKANTEPVKEDSILYRVRNGKVFATQFETISSDRTVNALAALINSIQYHLINRLTPILKDKTFYIPQNVTYVAPTSEKQFMGNIPEGSYIEIPRTENMVVGIHWYDVDQHRVDLDLKMLNLTEEYGWNAAYLSSMGDIVFSGDVTSAPQPDGATEVFLISPKIKNKAFLLKVNDFTQVQDEVPFEFFVAQMDNDKISSNFMVDPNKVLMHTKNKFENQLKGRLSTTPSLTLGYVEITLNSIKITFKNFTDVKGRISSRDIVNKIIFKYTDLYSKTQTTLNDLIELCGGTIVEQPYIERLETVNVNGETLYRKVQTKADYDLSLEKLTKESIIEIFKEV